jgi:cytochrome c biogenesis protein CcmG/thiol:disulfide interchange protein DsbE
MEARSMSKIKVWQVLVGGVVLAAIVWRVARSAKPHPVELGEKAPGFSIPRVPQGAISLAGFRGQVVVLNFWASWCPPCVDEAPSLEAFAQKVQGRGVAVLGVSVDQDPSALEKFIAQYHLTYPIARDPGWALAHRYGTYKIPETYIIDRTGHLAEKIIGETDWTDPRMLAYVQDLAGAGRQARR